MDKVTYEMYEFALKEADRQLDKLYCPTKKYGKDEYEIQEYIVDILDMIEEALDELRGMKEDA